MQFLKMAYLAKNGVCIAFLSEPGLSNVQIETYLREKNRTDPKIDNCS